MPISDEQAATINVVDHPDMRAVLKKLVEMDCEVLVPGSVFRIGMREFSFPGLTAFVCAHSLKDDGKPVGSPRYAEMAITRYQQIVPTVPLTAQTGTRLCSGPHDSVKAMAMAKTIAGWARAAAPPTDARLHDEIVEEGAHIILRWIENVKCRILGKSLGGRQIVLDLYGFTGAGKSSMAKALIAPLRGLAVETSDLDAILAGHEGEFAGTFVAIFLDDGDRVQRRMLPKLKQFVHADTWRANGKFKDAQILPMLASLIATHNPTPEEQFPDSAMCRRLGTIHWPSAFKVAKARKFVEEIFAFDMEALWIAVDPINRISDDDVIERGQRRYAIKDPLQWFIDDCTVTSPGESLLMADFYAAFRARASAGGWEVKEWTDRSVAAWLRNHRYSLAKGRGGIRIGGLALSESSAFGAAIEPGESEHVGD